MIIAQYSNKNCFNSVFHAAQSQRAGAQLLPNTRWRQGSRVFTLKLNRPEQLWNVLSRISRGQFPAASVRTNTITTRRSMPNRNLRIVNRQPGGEFRNSQRNSGTPSPTRGTFSEQLRGLITNRRREVINRRRDLEGRGNNINFDNQISPRSSSTNQNMNMLRDIVSKIQRIQNANVLLELLGLIVRQAVVRRNTMNSDNNLNRFISNMPQSRIAINNRQRNANFFPTQNNRQMPRQTFRRMSGRQTPLQGPVGFSLELLDALLARQNGSDTRNQIIKVLAELGMLANDRGRPVAPSQQRNQEFNRLTGRTIIDHHHHHHHHPDADPMTSSLPMDTPPFMISGTDIVHAVDGGPFDLDVGFVGKQEHSVPFEPTKSGKMFATL